MQLAIQLFMKTFIDLIRKQILFKSGRRSPVAENGITIAIFTIRQFRDVDTVFKLDKTGDE